MAKEKTMTKEEYQEQIPLWCALRTAEEHRDILLYCWGITAGFAKEKSYCQSCEFYNPDWQDNNN